MNTCSLDELNTLIDNCKKFEITPTKILVGYKAYAELMRDPKFADEVTYSALSPNKRKYRKIRIKITPTDYQLEVI